VISYNRLRFMREAQIDRGFRAAKRRRYEAALRFPTAPNPALPTFEQITDHEFLLSVARRAQRDAGSGPGPDGVRWPDLDRRALAKMCRDLSKSLRGGTFQPSPARAVKVPKRTPGQYRDLRIRSIATRLVSGALHVALTPLGESMLGEHVHGFRPHRSTFTLLRDLEHHVQPGKTVLTVADVYHAFDATPIRPRK